jgi:3-deoxy-D-manno-octulosonic-acid transferase
MLLYRLFIWLYPKIAALLRFTNQKAALWLSGRKGIFKKLSATYHKNSSPVIWMHCASVGEFEQGLPVLEEIRKKYPGYSILLTFFSPSGYELRKNYTGVDYVFYLPMDSPKNANRFFNIVQPSLVLFVKYEYWYYYLQEAKDRHIPVLLISGIFRNDQPFFKWYGGIHRKMLGFISCFFVQNPSSAALLNTIGIKENVFVTGDTRFDRVITIASHFSDIPLISTFCNNHPVIVAGSTWIEDDEELDHFANTNPSVRLMIAPHDIDKERLENCLSLYRHAILFSVYKATIESGQTVDPEINTLIIDNVGMLSKLYAYATIAYVGGGFGDDGIHNILEAAVYGKPVVFGPVYDKYFEADELLDAGGAFSIADALELEKVLQDLLIDEPLYHTASKAAMEYVRQKSGATSQVMELIQEKRLLIN